MAWCQTDVTSLRQVIANCEARVLRKEKVAAQDKVLSVSDADAAFIVKGERDPVVGYKPQLARSRQGFVTGLLVPQGNASDSDSSCRCLRPSCGARAWCRGPRAWTTGTPASPIAPRSYPFGGPRRDGVIAPGYAHEHETKAVWASS